MKAAVVIPVYKTTLTPIEKLSLAQCVKILGKFDLIYACPKGLDPVFENAPGAVEEFNEDYFKNIQGYNKLMLESSFYERFLQYDYILIYQLDAFVFRDELLQWCNKNYDYIGSPWIATRNKISFLLKPFASKSLREREPIFYKVGNGGFSLRKTRTFHKISKQLKEEINLLLTSTNGGIYAIEDVFWSIKAPEYFPDFAIPNYQEALQFAIDRKPDIALKLNNNKLPFGCHGINKNKVIKFWKPFIEKEVKEKG